MAGRSFLSTTSDGVARLVEGDDWIVDEHLGGTDVSSLATGPVGSGLVLAGTEGSGVFLSLDRGGAWEFRGLDGEHVMALAVTPSDPKRLYAGVRPPAVYRSDDGGNSWVECASFQEVRGRRIWRSPASPPFTAYVNGLAVSPGDPDLVVAGIEFGAVVRSTDGGETWSNHRRKAIRDCHDLVWHATDERCVYEGGAGVPRRPGARSTDGGETWRKPGGGLDRGYGVAVAADPGDPNVWYVSASTSPFAAESDEDPKAAVFRHEGGDAWEKLDAFPADRMPWALCTDPGLPDNLWAGRADGSIVHSVDRGESWQALEGALPEVEPAMVMLPPERV
ncbi:WD40/YVTN/BNR-like repeat-containing protein [Natronorarus salvus]|uniref:WD40/YVTN/BNR-like repeat-containing protein n=1 Tax=Natronorarus salvus TaxID=3117733 RepID=UPI002F263019